MYNRLYFFAAIALLSLFPLSSRAAVQTGGQSLTAQMEQLQATYQQLHSLQFDFTQVTDSGGRIKEGRGQAAFYRSGSPGSGNTGVLRWDYEEPAPQVILNNGRELSIYTPQDKQLIITPSRDLESDITFALFTGSKKLADEFVVETADSFFFINDPPMDLQAVQLIPRDPHPQIKRMQIWMDKQRIIHRLLMEDHFGALTELSFSRVRFNELPSKDSRQEQKLLQLDLAPGTETIRQ